MDTGLVEMIIYKSEDEGESFDVVQPHNVPEEIKTPEMIGILNEGLAVQLPGDITYYIGQRIGKEPVTLHTYGHTVVADTEDELYEKIVGRPKASHDVH